MIRVLRGESLRFADQIVNSASSAVFAFGAVLLLSAADFGRASLQLILMSVMLGFVRTAVYEAALFTRSDELTPRHFAWLMPRLALVCAGATGTVMLLVGIFVPGHSGAVVIAVAVVGATTLLADGVRYEALALDRPGAALTCDSIWLAGTIVGVSMSALTQTVSFVQLSWIYAVAAVLGAGIAHRRVGEDRSETEKAGRGDLRAQSRFGIEFALQIIPGQLVLVIAPAFIGIVGLGVYRAVVTLYQPLIAAATAVRLGVLGRIDSANRLAGTLGRTAFVLAAVSAGYLGLVITLKRSTTVLAHGALEGASFRLVVIYGVAEIARVALQPLYDVQRLRGQFHRLILLRSAQAIALVALSIIFAMMIGISGYALARLVTYAAPVVIFIWPRRARLR